VVCDDASTDGTLAIVERVADARVRIVRSAENLGAARNWDRAVGEARGAYVKLLCQDDTLRPTCLERQAAALDAAADGTVALVACRRDLIDDHDRVVMRDRGLRHVEGRIAGREMIRRIARSGTNPVGEPSATLARRDVLSRSGGFDPSERYMIDVDMWTRLLAGGDLHYIPESLCTFRLASTSWSARLARDQARQARHFVRKLRSRHPDVVGPVDVARGLVAATVLGWGRRLLYWRNRRRQAP
jgi:glycosyltransferase involved in cell wall biosynthesis